MAMKCPDCGYDGSPSGGSDFTAAIAECDRLRAALAASEREADRLRKLFDDAGQGEHNVLALVDHWQDEALKATAEIAELAADRDHWKLRAEIEREHVAVLTRRP